MFETSIKGAVHAQLGPAMSRRKSYEAQGTLAGRLRCEQKHKTAKSLDSPFGSIQHAELPYYI